MCCVIYDGLEEKRVSMQYEGELLNEALIGLYNKTIYFSDILHFTFHAVYSLAMMSETIKIYKD